MTFFLKQQSRVAQGDCAGGLYCSMYDLCCAPADSPTLPLNSAIPPMHCRYKYVHFLLTERSAQSWPRLLDEISSKMRMEGGVRQVYTTDGEPLAGPEGFVGGGTYVAVARAKFKPMSYRTVISARSDPTGGSTGSDVVVAPPRAVLPPVGSSPAGMTPTVEPVSRPRLRSFMGFTSHGVFVWRHRSRCVH